MDRRSFLKYLAIVPLLSKLELPSSTSFKPPSGPVKFASNKVESDQVKASGINSSWSELKPGDQMIIGGRPGMGKTLVALNILNTVCIEQGKKCVYFSLQERSEKLVQRLLAIRSGISLSKIEVGKLSRTELQAISSQSNLISEANLYIDDSADADIEVIISKIKDSKRTYADLKYVFIDYFQLISSKRSFSSRSKLIHEALKDLKKLAQDEKLILISLSQINRNYDKYNRVPEVMHLREIKDVSSVDQITLVFRDEYKYSLPTGERTGNEAIDFYNFNNEAKFKSCRMSALNQESGLIYD